MSLHKGYISISHIRGILTYRLEPQNKGYINLTLHVLYKGYINLQSMIRAKKIWCGLTAILVKLVI